MIEAREENGPSTTFCLSFFLPFPFLFFSPRLLLLLREGEGDGDFFADFFSRDLLRLFELRDEQGISRIGRGRENKWMTSRVPLPLVMHRDWITKWAGTIAGQRLMPKLWKNEQWSNKEKKEEMRNWRVTKCWLANTANHRILKMGARAYFCLNYLREEGKRKR